MKDLYEIAEALLPGVRLDGARVADDGNVHDVLLVPGVAAVRVSRRPLAAVSTVTWPPPTTCCWTRW